MDEGGAAPEMAPAANRAQGKSMRRLAFGIAFLLAACATASAPTIAPPPGAMLDMSGKGMNFLLAAPAPQDLGPDLKLWATHYSTPTVTPAPREMSAAIPLIGREGASISPPLRVRDWCEAALQGSVSVKAGGKSTAYVYVDDNGPEQANCDAFLGSLSDGVKTATRRARFMRVNHPMGCGVRNIPLMPFRTIAVDTSIIPLESVIFVPELRGLTFRYDDRDFTHDGYLFAGDRGGAIHGRHIDVFLADGGEDPFKDLFASTSSRTFAAYIVAADDPAAIAVRANHSGQCAEAPLTPK
jgi:3D (Asp-Asp-Asp) domain-containing protein